MQIGVSARAENQRVRCRRHDDDLGIDSLSTFVELSFVIFDIAPEALPVIPLSFNVLPGSREGVAIGKRRAHV